jgi:hypothetical protein
MSSYIWGKHLWFSMHFIALGYPQKPSTENVRDYRNYFGNLHRTIPCTVCSFEYERILQEHPLDLSHLKDNESLFRWTVDIHNMVNKKLNKQQMSQDDAWDFYNHPDIFNRN